MTNTRFYNKKYLKILKTFQKVKFTALSVYDRKQFEMMCENIL